MKNRIFAFAAPLAFALAAACTDSTGPAKPALAPPAEGSLAAVQCTVQVEAGAMRCDTPVPGGGARGDLIVGGQGTYVQVRSGVASYDSVAEVFSIDVTLQNLLGQPVGTEDGVTASGIRIFFSSATAVTRGTGTVELANPDGSTIFTTAGQDFFFYPEILAPYERTAPKPWRWNVSRTVESFSFTVLVAARVPNQGGVLRWTRERGDVVTRNLYAVWGTGPNDMWAAGDRTMMYNNGTRWVVYPGDWTPGVSALWGSATDDVWAVGGALWRYDGKRWNGVPSPVNENWSGAWGSSRNNVYITGGGFGWVLRWDGAAFDTVFQATPGRRFSGAWGFGPNDVHLAGWRYNPATKRDDGFVWHWNGAAWDSVSFPGVDITSIWGAAPNDIHAIGTGGAMFHYDGTAWTQVGQGLTTHTLYHVWGSSASEVWAVGGGYSLTGLYGTVLRWNGSAWSTVSTGAPQVTRAVFSPNPDKVYLVGMDGMIHRRSGGTWGAETSATQDLWSAVAPVSDDDVIAVRCGGVMRDEGRGWQTVYATPDCLEDVWITPGASQIFAVGQTQDNSRQGVVVRWDGTRWTRTLFPATLPRQLTLLGVWGLDSAHVYAVGWRDDDGYQRPVVMRWDGAAWTMDDMGAETGQLYAVWGTSPDNLYVVGTRLLHWDGTAWTPFSIHYWGDNWRDIWGTGPNDIYVVGGRVAHWDGQSWDSFYPRNNHSAQGVWGSGPDDVYVVGSQTLHFNGGSWTDVNIETSGDLYDVRGVSAGRVWAVGAGGVVMRGRR
ncbi:hypothetical protein [Longimicrobium sp.]|uniref:sialidase family protein n=1 Tax=Longimicrobium sp. TaxID=2029185 RepID=UPI002E324AA1|nr:hypothetical protein [Longimicrobium sp.]HEX6038413.1 hypothetical protein [Longimicrobium sp.]